MPSPVQSRLQTQDYQFQVVLPAGTWKWTTRVDVSQALPQYEIRNVISPYGLLRDMIPIPGPVVQSMNDSISQIQQSFTPHILLSATTLSFTIDEGRGVSQPQPVQVTNDGIFGSLLGVSIASSASFVAATPANVNGLAFSEAGVFQVTADSTNLNAVNSPYAATLTVQDPDATNSPVVIAVTVVVRPRAIITLSSTGLVFTVTQPPVGPYPPIPSQTFNLQNTGPLASVLNYQIQKLLGNSPWLVSFTPTFGTVIGGGTQPITVVVAPDQTLPAGSYMETLRVSGYSQNFFVDLPVTLNIT